MSLCWHIGCITTSSRSPVCPADLCPLCDFILAEFKGRQPLCPHRLGPVCTLLENHCDQRLAFAAPLDQELGNLAAERSGLHGQVIKPLVSESCHMEQGGLLWGCRQFGDMTDRGHLQNSWAL